MHGRLLRICLLTVACVSLGASHVEQGCPACRLLRARCPLDLTGMMAVLRRAMCMKHISVYLLFAVAIPSLCCADVTKLSPEDRKVLQDSSRFHEVHSTSDLPPASSRFAAASSQSRARSGTRPMRLSIRLSRQTPDLGSGRRRLLRRALRARRNRAHLLYVGCETGEGRSETSLECCWPSVQRLCGISRRTANWQAGRSLGLRAISSVYKTSMNVIQPKRRISDYRSVGPGIPISETFRFAQHDSPLYEISPKLATQQGAYHHGSSLSSRLIL